MINVNEVLSMIHNEEISANSPIALLALLQSPKLEERAFALDGLIGGYTPQRTRYREPTMKLTPIKVLDDDKLFYMTIAIRYICGSKEGWRWDGERFVKG